MNVMDVMTPQVEFIRSDDSIKQAALKMEKDGVGALPVILGEEAIGMITDRDIVIRSVAQGMDPEKHKVMEALTEGIISCKENDDVDTVLDVMEDNQIRRILVKDDKGQVTGIVSLGDLAVNLRKKKAGEVLQEVSKPSD